MTVVVPTYNRAELLKICLQSVLAQTHSNLEVIVVDDGSSDTTPQVLSEIKDPRLRTVRHDRQGAQVARNRGLAEATGDFISFLDDDDLWHPRKLEAEVQSFCENPRLDGVVCQTVWFRNWPGDHNYLFNRLHEGDPLTRFLRLDVVWQTAAPLWRTDFARRVGQWDERLTSGQDLDFHTRCLCLEPAIGYVDEVLNFFREHTGTRITKDRTEDHPENALFAMENAHAAMKARGILTAERGWAIASTVMRQARTLAFYGKADLVKRCLSLAKDSHPSPLSRTAIAMLLGPLTSLTMSSRPLKPLARAFRKLSHVLMLSTKLELPRVAWWQKYPYADLEQISAWKQELSELAVEAS